MVTVGGDVPALFSFAGEVRRRASAIETLCQSLTAMVEAASWTGPDRNQFLDEWQGRHRASLVTVASELILCADQVVRHAQDQENASR